ncbi:hypothetical protein BAE44_0022442 [Dichanthelium oligosanthes]|uniref:Uncharacterized protein n=1 Tax=Dichanthelium oligosanthes TaxID=888268 RepID=A0A1E5UUQ3_9POAL|nr:hypothetical protein BAE44_0022442 [Dichanthelium oligosanthes]
MPLHLAAAMDNDQAVKILLKHGADPNRVVHQVFSPLVMACCAKSLKCMKLLVKTGADVNFKSPSGRSVLSQAVDNGITDIVKFLLEARADPNIDDGVIMALSLSLIRLKFCTWLQQRTMTRL